MRDSSTAGDREAAWEVLLQTLGGPPRQAKNPDDDLFPAAGEEGLSVTLLSGFLGAGKTTLLCRLLEETPLRITAIVNDVAAINVDAAVVRARNAETIEFQNGCACCSLQTDLQEALEEIASRKEPPDAVLIEASGVADPIGIAHTVTNASGTALDGIVTLVDASSAPSGAPDPEAARLFQRQLAAAHLVILTKTEAVPDLQTLSGEIGRLAPGRPILGYDDLFRGGGETASQILLGAALRGARPAIGAAPATHSAFAVESRSWSDPLPAAAFFDLLDRLPESLYRMKGSVWLREPSKAGTRCVDVQTVGPKWRVHDVEGEPPESHLVLIGRAKAASFTAYATALSALSGRHRIGDFQYS